MKKTPSHIAGEVFFKLADERIGGPYLRYDNEKSNKAIGMPPEEQQSPAFSRSEPPTYGGYRTNDVSLPRYQFEVSEQPTISQTKMVPSAKETCASVFDDEEDNEVGIPKGVLLGAIPAAMGSAQAGMGMGSAFLSEIKKRRAGMAPGNTLMQGAKNVFLESPASTHFKILGKGLLRGTLGAGVGLLLGKSLLEIQQARLEKFLQEHPEAQKTAQNELDDYSPQSQYLVHEKEPPVVPPAIPPLVGGVVGAPLGWLIGERRALAKYPGYNTLDKAFDALESRKGLLADIPIARDIADVGGGYLWSRKEGLKMMGPVGMGRLAGGALGLGGGLLAGTLVNKALE